MATTLTDPLIGHLVDGRYEVVRRIARGGMATVYLARDRRLDRDVALKVMHPHLAEGTSGSEFVARFRREAKTAARLAHHGLVGVLDQGVDGDMSYLTMEYVEGTNLRRRLGELGALSVGESLRVAADVLDALTVAHQAGLVHRDIKPENVLIGTREQIKVADFGLARAITEVTSTTTGTILGTVAYLAPELVSTGFTDTRTDVYAVGILLYEMLTGAQPFTGATPIQVAYQHVHAEMPAPSDRVTWLPIEVDELVASLAARDPDDRPHDAAAALELVHRVRASLDETTLGRRADVPVVDGAEVGRSGQHQEPVEDEHAGAAGDVVATVDGPVAGDDPDATTRLEVEPAREPTTDLGMSRTIALTIGQGLEARTEAPASRRRRVWPFLLLALVLALAGGGWWYAAAGPGAWTTVPAGLVNAELATAKQALAAHGLQAGATTPVFSPTIPKGSVVSTDPAPGERIRKNGSVALAVSKGPDLRTVPSGLAGSPVADAVAALKAAGFDVPEPQHQYDDSVPAGRVLGISAEDGAQLPVGSTVTVTVSDGPKPVTVPSVLGQDATAAKKALEAVGLKVEQKQDYSTDYPEGQVMAQSLAPDTAAHRTDHIIITISQGPPLVTVPNVFGESEKRATKTLEDAGFQVKVTYGVFGKLFGARVVAQDPAADQQAPQGSTVTIKIG
ncbi:Stk1 family PASTA domain-containing Ser/Thr kinase [Isoptericola sp. b441]|uniref:non-specific serine/threonine protein kinase n=1 Tax=Actinotalea lenta TaxID=3064654 RepID=A0ABT9DAL8_9CELL|nr:Stk1 family PASTA domain-containing Ser/Thr kinase [Isoptericola sp. b441]MDO8107943.1 Stk1 family PASTA domain-containing Ser/Thr kinase [Isoptericola sp. b441]